MRRWVRKSIGLLVILSGMMPLHAAAQDDPRDRGDPAVIERELERREEPRAPQRPSIAPGEAGTADVATSGPELVLGVIRVEGARRLPAAAYASALEPYLGQPLAHPDLVRLASDVAAVARRAGFGLATAWVPQQDVVGGRLTVIVDEGRIDAVRVEGPAAARVERLLAHLVGERPVSTAELERRLTVAGDMSGIWVGEVRLVREGTRNILLVRTRLDRVHSYASIDNWGSETVGTVRGRITTDLNALFTLGDQLSVTGVFTPFEPDELQFARVRYALPIGTAGTELRMGGFVGHTRPGGPLRNRDLEGDSSEIELEIARPLARSRRNGAWLTGRVTLRDSELEEDGRLRRDDRIASAAIGVHGFGAAAGGRWRGRAALTQGFDLVDATVRGDPLASRDDAGGVFTRLDYALEFERRLGHNFSIELAAEGQFADRPLLSSEEMGLGGRRFGRAFDYREFSGDDGFAGAVELRFDLTQLPRPLRQVQLFAFADVGRVTNHGDDRGSGTLASAGAGLRVGLRQGIDAEVQLGLPLSDGATQADPQPRFSFAITARF